MLGWIGAALVGTAGEAPGTSPNVVFVVGLPPKTAMISARCKIVKII